VRRIDGYRTSGRPSIKKSKNRFHCGLDGQPAFYRRPVCCVKKQRNETYNEKIIVKQAHRVITESARVAKSSNIKGF